MAKKEKNINNAKEEKYTIKNNYDSNGADFKTTLKEVVISAYSCKTSKNDIKYF